MIAVMKCCPVGITWLVMWAFEHHSATLRVNDRSLVCDSESTTLICSSHGKRVTVQMENPAKRFIVILHLKSKDEHHELILIAVIDRYALQQFACRFCLVIYGDRIHADFASSCNATVFVQTLPRHEPQQFGVIRRLDRLLKQREVSVDSCSSFY